MVSLLTLDQSFGVRIPVSQPKIRFAPFDDQIEGFLVCGVKS
jgi:hypothetical protein